MCVCISLNSKHSAVKLALKSLARVVHIDNVLDVLHIQHFSPFVCGMCGLRHVYIVSDLFHILFLHL